MNEAKCLVKYSDLNDRVMLSVESPTGRYLAIQLPCIGPAIEELDNIRTIIKKYEIAEAAKWRFEKAFKPESIHSPAWSNYVKAYNEFGGSFANYITLTYEEMSLFKQAALIAKNYQQGKK